MSAACAVHDKGSARMSDASSRLSSASTVRGSDAGFTVSTSLLSSTRASDRFSLALEPHDDFAHDEHATNEDGSAVMPRSQLLHVSFPVSLARPAPPLLSPPLTFDGVAP